MSRALVLVLATALLALTAIAAQFDPIADGLRAEYFPDASWQSSAVLTRIEPFPSTDTIQEAWRGNAPRAFGTAWTGTIVTLREGPVTFGTISDRRSSVFVDGQLVVDNPAGGAVHSAAGSVFLSWGGHNILVRYEHDGGPIHMELLWGTSGAAMKPVPASALHPRKPRPSSILISLVLRSSLAAVEWIWVASMVGCVLQLASNAARRMKDLLEREGLWRSLRWILLGSLVLNLTGLWWGLPSIWVRDELTPGVVLRALSQRFSNGWFDRWPPLHYYVLTTTMSPVLLLDYLGRIDMYAGFWPPILSTIGRLTSVAAAGGTVIATALVGARTFGIRAGLFASAAFALAAPFVFYAKTANLDAPFVFWFAASLVFFVGLMQRGRLWDYVLFAATATLAVCTKDQAYALYVFVPLLALQERWRAVRAQRQPWSRVLVDRRAVAALATAATLFAVCHNLFFNLAGFVQHVRYITGPGNQLYRGFPATAAGRIDLLALTLELIKVSWGWPLTLVGVAGAFVALRSTADRRRAIWLLAPAVSYYLTFINVVLYNYDRFVLPMCLILAIFAGLAIDRFLTSRTIAWRTALVCAVFAYTLAYSATVDALMLTDSRHVAERWMAERVGRDELVGVTGLHELLPRLRFRYADISTVADLMEAQPAYFVLNADYTRAVAADTPRGQLISGLETETIGYRLAFRLRRESPWPWLPGAHPAFTSVRRETPVYWASILRDINPTIEIFRRDRSATAE